VAHAVIATFDPVADGKIRAIWTALSDHAIDSSMAALDVSPHITLAVMNNVAPGALTECAGSLATRTVPFSVRFDHTDLFPGHETVLFLAPQNSRSLVAVHKAFHESAVGIGVSTEHTRPGTWVPHVTLAMALRKQSLAAAQNILSEAFQAFSAQVTGLAVVRFDPTARLARGTPLSCSVRIART